MLWGFYGSLQKAVKCYVITIERLRFAGLRLGKQAIFNSKQYKQRKKKGAKKFGAAKKARGVKAKTQTGVYAYIQTEKKGTVF